MATMSAARIRSMYRRSNQAYEAVYHFSANSVWQVGQSGRPTNKQHSASEQSEHGVALRSWGKLAGTGLTLARLRNILSAWRSCVLWFYKSFFTVFWIAFLIYWQIKAVDTKTTQRLELVA